MRAALRSALSIALIGALAVVPARATYAQPADPAASAVATQLAEDAAKLMDEGKFDQACPKLEEAVSILPDASGIIVLLARCYEGLHRFASAWSTYRKAADLLTARGDPRASSPATNVARLEPTLSKLEIVVPKSVVDAPGGVISRDRQQIGHAQWNTSVPVDGGTHVIRLEVPGKEPVERTVDVKESGDAATVTLPDLSELVDAPKPVGPPPDPPKPDPPRIDTPADPPRATPVWAWAVGGAGIAAIAVGAGFRIDGYLVEEDQADECGPSRDACPSDYDVEGTNAQKERDYGVFVGMTVAGSLAVGIGIVGLVVHAVDAPSTKKQVGPAAPAPTLTSVAPWFDGRRAFGVGATGTF